MSKKILGRAVHKYRGCHDCPARVVCSKGLLTDTAVQADHIGRQLWEDCGTGRAVQVFSPHERVKLSVRSDPNTIYCGTAESTRYPGVVDFVNLANFDGFKEDK